MNTKTNNYEYITVIRALSCLGVVVYHFSALFDIRSHLLRTVFDFGKYGVLFFFLITGMLAFSSSRYGTFYGYYKNKIVRLLPMYLLSRVLYYVIFWVTEGSIYKATERMLEDPYRGGTWTLFVTACFYVMFPVARRIVRNYWTSTLLFLICFGIRFVVVSYGIGAYGILDNLGQYLVFVFEGVWIYYSHRTNRDSLTIIGICLLLCGLVQWNYSDTYLILSLVLMIVFMMIRNIEIDWENVWIYKPIKMIARWSYEIYLFHSILFHVIEIL